MTEGKPTPTAPYTPFEVGQDIGGQFNIERLLGTNEVGSVYLGRKKDDGLMMILKVVSIDAIGEEGYQRLRQQVKTYAKLRHKHLARVFGLGREGQTAFVVMEHLEGQTLADYLRRRRKRQQALSPKGIFNLIGHVCSGLKKLHDAGLVHGAMTPRHIFVTPQGRVKVSNLAYGAFLGQILFAQDQGIYTDSPFVAPELRKDPLRASVESDVYSLGIIAAELLSPSPLTLDQARERALEVADASGPDIVSLIEDATTPDPNDRLADVAVFRQRIKALVEAPSRAHKDAQTNASEDSPQDTSTKDASAGEGSDHDDQQRSDEENEREGVSAATWGDALANAQPVFNQGDEQTDATDDELPEPPPEEEVEEEEEDPFAMAARVLGQTGAFRSPVSSAVAEVAAEAAKANNEARYLVSKEGLDHGPYTYEQVLKQLHGDEINEFTPVLDRTTGKRLPLEHVLEFTQAVRDYLPVRAERRRLEEEHRAHVVQTAKNVGYGAAYGGVALGVLVGIAFCVYWFVFRAKPVELPTAMLMADLSSEYKMLPPPKEFGQLNVDAAQLAALFNEGKGERARRGRKGRAGRRGRRGNAGAPGADGGAPGDDGMDDVADFTAEGGSDHVLTDQEVTRVVLSNFGSLQGCLASEMKRNPGFKGVNVKFFIKQSGSTAGVQIVEGAYRSGPVASCLTSRFRVMKFPAHGGFNKGVIFPLIVKR